MTQIKYKDIFAALEKTKFMFSAHLETPSTK